LSGAGISLADEASAPVRHVRREKAQGVYLPVGVVYSSDAGGLLLLGKPKKSPPASHSPSRRFGSPSSRLFVPGQISETINATFDARGRRFLVLEDRRGRLLEIPAGVDGRPDPQRRHRFDVNDFHVRSAQGIAVDPERGRLLVLDAPRRAAARLLRVETGPSGDFADGAITSIDLRQLRGTSLRGLALDPSTGHLHVLSAAQRTLYELTQEGVLVATRDLSAVGLVHPGGMAFAPSGDTTDDPSQLSLYVADAGGGTSGSIVELSLARTVVPAMAGFTSSLVAVTLTSLFDPPSPDPSGIEYVSSSNTLHISDGEVEEVSLFAGAQVWETTLGGSVVDTFNLQAFTNEPVGVAFNPLNEHVFYSDDNVAARTVTEVDAGSDGLYHTADDVRTSFSAAAFGDSDPEGAAFDSLQGALFLTDGVNSEVYRVAPGPNGVFDGVAPAGDDLVTHFDTAIHGLTDPEGIAFDPDRNVLYVVGHPPNLLFEMTTTGALVQTIDIAAASAVKPAGLACAPGSMDSSATHIYIVDRGIDNNSDPNENDGKLYEMTLPPGNSPPVVSAGPDQSVVWPATASLDGTVTDDGLPNPPGVTSTWSKFSGPGTVTFGDPGSVDTTASFSAPGIYVLRLTANDGALSTSDDVTITVNGANQAPLVGAGPDQTVWLPASAQLEGAVSDDGLPNPPAAVTSTWSELSGPGSVTFGNSNLVSTTASFSEVGVYVLRLSATDGELSASDNVTILVNDSQNQVDRQPKPSPWVPVQ
jgi:hypothetical protein